MPRCGKDVGTKRTMGRLLCVCLWGKVIVMSKIITHSGTTLRLYTFYSQSCTPLFNTLRMPTLQMQNLAYPLFPQDLLIPTLNKYS